MRNPFRKKEKALQQPASQGAWTSLLSFVREPFAGAWQRNLEINQNTVLSFHAVFSCISLIASDIAKMPLRMMQRDSKGIWKESSSGKVAAIYRRPNAFQNRIQFFECWLNSKLCHGNTIALKIRNSRGEITELRILDWNKVTPLVADDGSVFYQINPDNMTGVESSVTVPAREVIHDRFNCLFHPLVGLSPIYAAGLAAMQGHHIQENSAFFFRNGSKPSGVIEVPGNITEENARILKANWDTGYTGENAGKTGLLSNGAKYNTVSMSADDAKMVEQLQMSAKIVCSAFHVPAYKAGIGELPSYDNIEALEQQYYSQCLQALIESIELLLDEAFELEDGTGIYSGRYLVRVRAVNASDVSSVWATSSEVNLTGKVGNPPKPVGFIASENVVFGIELNWGFPENTDDTLKTEIQYSLTGSEDDAILLADVPYPARKYQQMGLKAGQIFWYRAQLVDRTGNESGYTDWVRGQANIDVSDITDAILEEIKDTEVFKDLIESAVDSNAKIAGMADDIKQNADELEQQALAIQENSDGLAQAEVKIDEISVSMDGMTGGVKNSSIAVIQNSLAQVTSRRSQTATNNGNVAKIDRIDTTIADTSQAVARALVTLDASAGGNVSNATDLTETLADFTQASATKINSLTVTVNGQTAAINQTAQAVADVNGNLNAMYNIKVAVDANGRQYAAGMGIGVQNTPSGMQSQVLFVADRFAVMAQAGGNVSLPFVIQNGQTFIRETFIQDGTISNAKIGNFIQSNNYVAGSAGWRLDKGGTWENYGTDGTGAMKQTNVTISVKDENGRLRCQFGKITGVF